MALLHLITVRIFKHWVFRSFGGPQIACLLQISIPSVQYFVIYSGLFKHGLSISKAYLVDISKPEDRASVLGYFNAISSSGFIIGPLISGYVANWDPTLQLSLAVGAAIFALNFFIVLFLLPSSEQNSVANGKKSRGYLWFINFDDLYRTVTVLKGFHWRDMKDIIVIRFLGIFAMMIFRQNFPVFLEENFSLSSADLGKVISYSGMTAAIASAICGTMSKYYTGFSKHAFRGFILMFISLDLIVFSSNLVHVLVSLFLLSLSTSYLRISMLTMMLESGRPDEKGAILGLTYSLSSISRMLAPSVVGVAQEFGSLACCSLAAMLALAALLGIGII